MLQLVATPAVLMVCRQRASCHWAIKSQGMQKQTSQGEVVITMPLTQQQQQQWHHLIIGLHNWMFRHLVW